MKSSLKFNIFIKYYLLFLLQSLSINNATPLSTAQSSSGILKGQPIPTIFAYNENSFKLADQHSTTVIKAITLQSTSTDPSSVSQTIETTVTLDSEMTLLYTIISTDTISITLKSSITVTGWMAIGFGSQSMSNSDVIRCYVSNSQGFCEDQWSTANGVQPTQDTVQNVAFISFTASPLSFTFSRQLISTDKTQDVDITLDQVINVIFAQNNNNNNLAVAHTTRGSTTITFTATAPTPTPSPEPIPSPAPTPDPTPSSVIIDTGKKLDGSDFNSKLDSKSGNFQLFWNFIDSTAQPTPSQTRNLAPINYDTIQFLIISQGRSAFALAFGGGMKDVDMVIAELDSGNAIISLTDCYATGQHSPGRSEQQDFSLVNFEVSDKEIKYRFQRKLDTGDKMDTVLSVGMNIVFSWARTGGKNLFSYHGSTQERLTSITLSGKSNVEASSTGFQLTAIQNVHKFVMLIGWGFLVDLGIIFARYFRGYTHYMNLHAVIFFIVTLSTVIMNIIMLYNYFPDSSASFSQPLYPIGNKIHLSIGMSNIILVLIQLLMGNLLYLKINSFDQPTQAISKIQLVHQIIGYSLYLIGKVNIIFGLNFQDSFTMSVFITVFILMLAIIFFFEILFQTAPEKLFQNQSWKREDKEEYESILEALSNGIPVSEITSLNPKIKWVIVDNSVYDLSEFVHPGGNFIIQNCIGREVGRFFYGAYGLESTNLKPHTHSIIAKAKLAMNYIGTIGNKNFDFLKTADAVISQEFDESFHSDPQDFQLIKTGRLSNNVTLFCFRNQTCTIQYCPVKVEWFGRHFTICAQTKENNYKVRLYTTVLCMSEAGVSLRERLINVFNECQGGSVKEKIKVSDIQKQGNDLFLLIQKYDVVGGFSKYLFDLASKNDYMGVNFSINGPLGVGLELNNNSSGTHVIFAAGTGIFPFLDLLDFLLQKLMYECLKKSVGKDVAEYLNPFNYDFNNIFSQNFQVLLFGAFANQEEFVGLKIVQFLGYLEKKFQIGLFEEHIRFSNQDTEDDITPSNNRFDQDFIARNIGVDAKKVYICGPPVMNKACIEAVKQINFDMKKVIFV